MSEEDQIPKLCQKSLIYQVILLEYQRLILTEVMTVKLCSGADAQIKWNKVMLGNSFLHANSTVKHYQR